MKIIFLLTIAGIACSYVFDKKKTIAGVKAGTIMFLNILPAIFVLILLVSLMLTVLPEGLIALYLGKNAGFSAYIIAAFIGSIALIPGFIAFPLAGILLRNGVSYQVVSIFISTLLMVGIITLPLEARYYGWRVAITRNILYFIGAIIAGSLTGLIMYQ